MVRETELLAIVRRRASLLRRLATDPARPSALAAELELSRSTIDRGLSELQRAALIERATVDGQCQYRLTVAGDLALSSFEQLSDRLAQATRRSELLAELPPSAELSWQVLDGATAVTAATEPAQVAESLSIEGVLESLASETAEAERPGDDTEGADAESDRLESMLSALLRLGSVHQVVVPGPTHCLASAYCEALAGRGVVESADGKKREPGVKTVEVIAPQDAIQVLLSTFGSGTASALAADQLVLHETTQPPAYGLVSVELDAEPPETEPAALTILLVCDGGGPSDELCGLLVNDSPDAAEWARDRITSLMETAQRLSMPSE
ncbi:hypothetical protein C483_18668 [Natrialba hulunbeirensis JCM 10989]|uniref:HTH arsR-type domain-containing protein n=1 Tax=Natrialba hulunbeirensis JCM 10989 TaxID=1227493 RepID=L9ZMQ1_9EURY|nr:hypothetical protein [Natrialba hulunbeirensis]ELY87341.1 hypothetical protein C483_18668 [Natrialba hulunbeirensis JCM 10989]